MTEIIEKPEAAQAEQAPSRAELAEQRAKEAGQARWVGRPEPEDVAEQALADALDLSVEDPESELARIQR